MENTKYTDLIGRFLSGEITADEKAVLMAWADADSANRAFFDEMARLWSVSGEYEEEVFTTDIETAWVSFEKKFEQRFPSGGGEALPGEEKPEGKVIRMRPMRLVLRYAAVLAALAAAGAALSFGGLWFATQSESPAQLGMTLLATVFGLPFLGIGLYLVIGQWLMAQAAPRRILAALHAAGLTRHTWIDRSHLLAERS